MNNLSTPSTMITDPLMSHLLDILSHPASKDMILAGGFGMRIKQNALEEQIKAGMTLIPNVPIGKQLDPVNNQYKVKIDLLARQPQEAEDVIFDECRVGRGTDAVPSILHGRTTPEAFAVDDLPMRILVQGRKTDGTEMQAEVFVPHPYASLCMKIKAAHDWLCMTRGELKEKPFSTKHVYDVYLLVAMMLPNEFEDCRVLAAQYADSPHAEEIKRCAVDLFASPGDRASREIQRQIGGQPYDRDTFWEALQDALGVK